MKGDTFIEELNKDNEKEIWQKASGNENEGYPIFKNDNEQKKINTGDKIKSLVFFINKNKQIVVNKKT